VGMGSCARTGANVRRWRGQGPEGGEGSAVFGSGVALVRGEAVAGVGGVELAHEAVAMDLGDDGRGGDGEGEGVAVEEAGLAAG